LIRIIEVRITRFTDHPGDIVSPFLFKHNCRNRDIDRYLGEQLQPAGDGDCGGGSVFPDPRGFAVSGSLCDYGVCGGESRRKINKK
jgi:hypothetical protein